MAMRSRKMDVWEKLPQPDVAKVTRRGPQGTSNYLVQELGLSKSNVLRYLHQLNDAGLAYIACWNRSTGNFHAVWVQGKGEHAPQPKPYTNAQCIQRSRAKIKKAVERGVKGFSYDERYKGKVALAKAAEVAQKTRIAPQHWFSPLGL